MPSQNSVLAARPANPHAGIGDKIRGAMAVGKTRWGMLALVFFATPIDMEKGTPIYTCLPIGERLASLGLVHQSHLA